MASLLMASDVGRRESATGPRPGEWLIRGLSIALEPGESVAVAGPSGSGKTLFLRALAGLDPLDEGEVTFDGASISDLPMPEYRSRVVYLHQRPALGEGTGEESLRRVFSLRAHRHRAYDGAMIERRLRDLGRDPALISRPTATLSGGEQQLIAFLRALQIDPQVLLLDEPTTGLDPEAVEAIEALVARWRSADRQRASVWITHDPDQMDRVARRSVRIAGGTMA